MNIKQIFLLTVTRGFLLKETYWTNTKRANFQLAIVQWTPPIILNGYLTVGDSVLHKQQHLTQLEEGIMGMQICPYSLYCLWTKMR